MAEERRLFIGIPVPEKDSRTLHALDPKIQGLKWLDPSVHHVTLCFIGESSMDPEEVLSSLREHCEQIPPFSLPFEGLMAAPPKKPYMIWARYLNVPEFQELHEQLLRTFVPEKAVPGKQAIPHITLGRMKRGKLLDKASVPSSPELDPLVVDRAVLWHSLLQKGGAVHHPLGEAFLGGETQ